jgi:UDP-3-O-[3-hydroxymyristoyl] glucosamine N-acyltransferase
MQKTLQELALLTGGRVVGDGSAVITGVASIEDAGPGDITFLADKKLSGFLATTKASAVITGAEAAGGVNQLIVKNPLLAFSVVLDVFRPAELPQPGISPKAEIHPGAVLGSGVSIQAFAVVEAGASVGDRVILFPGAYVGRNAEIGEDSILYPGVVVREECRIGKRVIIHSNTVVGSDGFGYVREGTKYMKVPQRGIVRIEDDVELGACVTVDRATIGETVIGRGSKIDNLVQIAHNVKIGSDTVMAAQTGIAGSTRVGNRVLFGGQVGLAGHIAIGDDTMIGAQSGVMSDVPGKVVWSGSPAMPHRDWLKAQAVFAKLPELKKKIEELEKKVSELGNPKGPDNG